jgi:hypothetical protein
MSITILLFELIADVLETASLARRFRWRKGAVGFPTNKCAECSGKRAKIRENEEWVYYQCGKCQKNWVIPQSEETYEKIRKRRKKSIRRRTF